MLLSTLQARRLPTNSPLLLPVNPDSRPSPPPGQGLPVPARCPRPRPGPAPRVPIPTAKPRAPPPPVRSPEDLPPSLAALNPPSPRLPSPPGPAPPGRRLQISISSGFRSREAFPAAQSPPPPAPGPSAAPGSAPIPHSPSQQAPPSLPSPQPRRPLTSAVEVELHGPTFQSASEAPPESGAVRTSPEWSAWRGGGGVRGGEPAWRRGRWRLRAGIAPAPSPPSRQLLGAEPEPLRGAGPTGGRRSTTGEGAGPRPEGTLDSSGPVGEPLQESRRVPESEQRQSGETRGWEDGGPVSLVNRVRA